jgi:carboxymethylenebutenolidase
MIDTVRAAAVMAIVSVAGLGTAIRAEAQEKPELPPDAELALSRLAESPRHGEWIDYDAGNGDMVTAWVVYPERSGAAPVMVVIHEIFGLTDWVRGVADQLAAEGFIAIAPDLLSGRGDGTDSFSPEDVRKAIRELDRGEVNRRLRAAAGHVTALPSATERKPWPVSEPRCWVSTEATTRA